MPQVEAEGLTIEDGQERGPCILRLDVKEGAQIIKERLELSIGQRVVHRAREQARGDVLVQASSQ